MLTIRACVLCFCGTEKEGMDPVGWDGIVKFTKRRSVCL